MRIKRKHNKVLRLNKFWRFILSPFKSILGTGYGHCWCCGFTWNLVDGHSTKVTDIYGMFPVCVDCWDSKSDEEIIKAYNDLYDAWLSGYGNGYTKTKTEADLNFTRQQMMEALMKDLHNRHNNHSTTQD